MPRIKAIVSGTLPSFMDFILNLNAYQFHGDNLIEQAYKRNKKIVFYGDDTWLAMFHSHMFLRSNGTTSFFATDYTQVDSNVTYNVDKELKKLHEWDYMILHYLGVDHIGHSHGGAKSRIMPTKLLEMDRVIENIYSAASYQNDPYLITIFGDHGMTDIGNHGGNSKEETDTAAVFLSTRPVIKKSLVHTIQQIDIAVTLATLLGLSIPKTSKGKVSIPILESMNVSKPEQLCALHLNAMKLYEHNLQNSKRDDDALQQVLREHRSLISTELEDLKKLFEIEKLYVNYIDTTQVSLVSKTSKTSIFSILTLSICLAMVCILALVAIENQSRFSLFFSPVNDFLSLFCYVGIAFQVLCFCSTSFMEMEHYYWFYFSATLSSIFLLYSVRNFNLRNLANEPFFDNSALKIIACVLVFIIQRVTSYWNQQFQDDFGDFLNKTESRHILSPLVIFSLTAISYMLSIKRFGKQQCLLISGFVWVYLYRTEVGSLSAFRIPYVPHITRNFRAQLVYFHVSLIIFETCMAKVHIDLNKVCAFFDYFLPDYYLAKSRSVKPMSSLRTLCTVWVLLSCLLLKVHNIPLLTLHILMEKLLYYANHWIWKGEKSKTSLIISYLCFAQSAFYSQGNSNTLSTIDVSSGFIGIDSYNPFIVGCLMVVATYSFFVYWILMLFIRIKELKHGFTSFNIAVFDKFFTVINFLLITRFIAVTFFMCVALALRDHLFIWSVICPKFLYEASLTILLYIIAFLISMSNLID